MTIRCALLIILLTVASFLPVPVHAQSQRVARSRTQAVVLGSGTPAADPDRWGSGIVVVVDNSAYLFDAGVGVVRHWAGAIRKGVTATDVAGLRHIFFTHLHSDHTLGYPDLIFSSWTLDDGQDRPFEVYGPPGVAQMNEHILAAYSEDVRVRTGKGGELAGKSGPVVHVHEVEPGVVYSDSLVEIRAFAVPHGTWEKSFGYRIRTPDKVIVLSGDTGPTNAVAEQCNGCDLLFYEGGTVTNANATPYFQSFHTTSEELARVANLAKPKLLVLYHQRPSNPATETGYATLRALYAGAFIVANDLQIFR